MNPKNNKPQDDHEVELDDEEFPIDEDEDSLEEPDEDELLREYGL